MLSVVVPVFDAADVLEAQLDALDGQSAPEDWEVILADNGSTDGSAELGRRWAAQRPRFRWLDASGRRGPGAARNLGAAGARGDRILFCDSDDIVGDDWLRALSAGLDDGAVAVGYFDFHSLNGRAATPPTDPWPRQFAYLPAGLGANMAVRRDAFEAVGGFDESLRVGEDLDLCWRLQLRGEALVRVEAAVVAKRDRSSARQTASQCLRYGRSNVDLFVRFRAHGMRRNWALAVKSTAWALVNVLALVRGREQRERWLRVVFTRIGQVQGSITHRTLYP